MILVPRILDARVFSPDMRGVGVVTKTFLDIDQRRLVALAVKAGPFKKTKILQISDIEIIDDNKIVMSKDCSLKHKKKMRQEHLSQLKGSLVGGIVKNSSGEYLGKVRSASYRLGDGALESISISKNAFVTMTSGGHLVESKNILSLSAIEIKVDEDKLINNGSRLAEHMSVLGTKMATFRKEAENLVSSRERSFIIGKTSVIDIMDEAGKKVVGKGEIITDDHISRASEANKLHHLTLAAGSVEIRTKLQNRRDKK